jgi:hypothetical protein
MLVEWSLESKRVRRRSIFMEVLVTQHALGPRWVFAE